MDLVGRVEERRQINGLLDAAHRGAAGTLVIRGEPGVGKTTLVEYAVRSADDLQVVYLTGVESERELGYAALHRLLTPILKRIDKLPEAQRVAMEAAFGLGPRASTDRFMIGLATVTLAAESASFRPLLCVIDDAQWVDRESIDALAFWGRRLHAERCALLFAERSILGVASPLDAFPVLELGGLAEAEAYALLATHAVSGLDRDVAGRLVAETSGNPLALIELAKSLTGDQLSGAVLLPDPMPLGRHLEEHFLRQVRALPAETQLMLLLAATDPTGDPVLLAHAAERQGVPEDAAITAEAAGLVSLLPRVRFRHPLVRSAIYSGAQAADRRRAHATLAAVTDETIDPVRRAWHLANAAASPDEAVAMLLERTAQLAQERGGRPAEAAFLRCAADLTPDRDRAAERRVGAAEAALAAGSAVQAQEILDLALPDLRDPYLRAQADRLLGISWMLQGRTSVASTVLFEAALAARPFDATMSRWTMLEAFEAACLSGGQGVSWRDIAREAMNDLDAASDRVPIVDDLLAAMATGLTTDYVAAVPFLRRAVGALATEDVPMADALRWSMLGSFAARALWDQDAHETIVQRLATISRADGALRWLQLALRGCATAELWSGRFGRADTYSEEANEISAATDSRFPLSGLTDIDVLAWKGRNKKARIRADTTLGLSEEDGMGASRTIVAMALTVLDLADGNYDDALRHARAVFDEDLILFSNQILSDMVEAAVRAGDADAAKLALDRLGVRAPASGSAWATGVLARSRAMVATDGHAEALYVEASRLLASTRMTVEVARSHLLYGEWLRRQRRRADARDELRAAHNMFVTMGADGFAERARLELLATGEHARKRTVETTHELTPQEAHVARLASEGHTNSEIAARLFISASTVEYHLRKVFRKLTVTSRRQLKGALVD